MNKIIFSTLLACGMFCASSKDCSTKGNFDSSCSMNHFVPGNNLSVEAYLLAAKMLANNPFRLAFLEACRPVDESSSLNFPSSTSSDFSTKTTITDEEIQAVISRMSGDYSSSSQNEESNTAMLQARELVAEMFGYEESNTAMLQARKLVAEMFQVQNPS